MMSSAEISAAFRAIADHLITLTELSLGPTAPPPAPRDPPVDAQFSYLTRSPVPVREDHFGWTVLHAGQSYGTALMTPEPVAVPFKLSRIFFTWEYIERTPGAFDYTCPGMTGQNKDGLYKWMEARGIAPVAVIDIARHPAFLPGKYRGVLANPTAWTDFIKRTVNKYPCVAVEIANEPEVNWRGSLDALPVGTGPQRKASSELAPYARYAREALAGTGVEVWGLGCQSMADGQPTSGLAATYCDPSTPYFKSFGRCFTDGDDGAGGTGGQHLDRFTFHGYPSGLVDPTLLPAHIAKARGWGYKQPLVVTEHGVVSDKDHLRWDLLTDAQRERWVMTAFGVAIAHDAQMIYYAYDEDYMGLYGKSYVPNVKAIAAKYSALRSKLLGNTVVGLRKGSTGQLALEVQTAGGLEVIALE